MKNSRLALVLLAVAAFGAAGFTAARSSPAQAEDCCAANSSCCSAGAACCGK